MAFFKKFGGKDKKSKGKESDEVEERVVVASTSTGVTRSAATNNVKYRQQEPSKSRDPATDMSRSQDKQTGAGQKPDEEADFDLPPSFTGSRKDRNMSISRSGRHKYRNKQRGSVLKDDWGSSVSSTSSTPPVSPTSPVAASTMASSTIASSGDRGTTSMNPISNTKNRDTKTSHNSASASKPASSSSTSSSMPAKTQSGSGTSQQQQQKGSFGRASGACRESESTARRLSNDRRVVRQTAV